MIELKQKFFDFVYAIADLIRDYSDRAIAFSYELTHWADAQTGYSYGLPSVPSAEDEGDTGFISGVEVQDGIEL